VSVTGDGIDASYLDCILDHVRKKVVGRVVCAEADPFRKRPGQGKFKRVSSEILPTSASSDGVRI
jgi:hypothetical protein